MMLRRLAAVRTSDRRHAVRAVAVAGVLAAAGLAAPAVTAASVRPAVTDKSPVDLATPVSFAAGQAHQSAIVRSGDARFEVLSPTLVRLEYSPAGHFENDPTVNVLNRRFPVPAYRSAVSGGWLTLQTAALTLRYQVGSGPFGPKNTVLTYRRGGSAVSVHPAWEWECPFGQSCQAGAAALAGGAAIATNHTGYLSTAGFVANLGQASGASATWTVLGAPAGRAVLRLRYANSIGALGGPAPRTIDLEVNGTRVRTLTLPPTASWNNWRTVTTTAPLRAGTNTVTLACAAGDSCNVNLDTLAVGPAGAPAPVPQQAGPLGGWIRSFDYYTYASGPYSTGYTCPSTAVTAADCQAYLEPLHRDGLLDRAGWRLLDDTQSAVWTRGGWVTPRPAGGDAEDGYLFAYGTGYQTALRDFSQLTGPAPLLPDYLFGVWYSRYYPYTTADYENQLIPAFRRHNVPLDTLSVDTDWKAPNTWDGWEWNPALFPHPAAFLKWAQAQDIHVTLNIHSSISDSDPKLAEAERIAGGNLASATCFSGPCKVWDWSQIPQAESNFALQQSFEKQGVAFWWLDWCCDNSNVSMPGLTPDAWINHLYAQEMVNSGQRGFVLARIGSSYQSPGQVYPAGPWSNHTSTVDFTGDTWGTWNTLARQAQLSPDEASIGEPYVSDDIGSFLGPPPGRPSDTPDLYDRWVQLGAFQPILRLHSSFGNRLPWNYPQPVAGITESFLRLREALVPYTYTLAAQAAQSGLPITRPLYLDYPTVSAAYDHPGEYLYGPDVLVAPVTTPGQVAKTTVWFPPGRWTDYFTGATFSGPGSATLNVPLDRMPVFVRAGGIVPEQPGTSHVAPSGPLTLDAYAGGDGQFTLYSDAGQGLGYTKGQYATTPICYAELDFGRSGGGRSGGGRPGGCWDPALARAAAGHSGAGVSAVAIGAARGSYPGEPASRSYTVNMINLSQPRLVLVNGRPVPAGTASGAGWHYDAATDTVVVRTPSLPTGQPASVVQIGGHAVTRAEPAAVGLTLRPPTPLRLAEGTSTTVRAVLHNDGPGAVTGIGVRLTAPAGWTVTPSQPVTLARLAAGGSASVSWTVTAPAAAAGTKLTAKLQATASYTSQSDGAPGSVTVAEQPAPPAPPPPPPSITTVAPPSGTAGTVETLTGSAFGASQGSSYLTLADAGTSWGAPFDGATLTIKSWSDSKIVFVLPYPSGPGGVWHLVPGTTATVTVTTSAGTSSAANITIPASSSTQRAPAGTASSGPAGAPGPAPGPAGSPRPAP